MTNPTIEFNEILWDYYSKHGRHDLPWRQPEENGLFDPYKILVSELMLQQTQVGRVVPKFHEFLIKFPNITTLSQAPLAEVLTTWSGLGYNRRAKFLWQAAQQIQNQYAGLLPNTVSQLVALPGIGKNTAGAILAYAFNRPTVFVETNVRTVYIHHFFKDQIDVPDVALIEKLEETLDHEQPREFYWALMDYGSYLKQTVGNLNKYSKTYSKQSKFEGSRRQIRGQVLRELAVEAVALTALQERIPDERLESVLTDLVREELISQHNDMYSLYVTPKSSGIK